MIQIPVWQIYFLWFVRSVDSLDAGIYAEIRTRIPDTISWDYNFEPAGNTPITFTVKVLYAFTTNFIYVYMYTLIICEGRDNCSI